MNQYYFPYLRASVYKFDFSIRLLLLNFLFIFVTSSITIMNTRLKQFLAAENITQAQFADNIKVVRASVSHVLSGRNKPSYEFILSIMTKYPNLNIEWLMFGKGKMYKDARREDTSLPETDVLFPEPMPEETFPCPEERTEEPFSPIETSNNITESVVNQRKVVKVIVLFDDGSYQEM